MKRMWILVAVITLFLAACGPQASPEPARFLDYYEQIPNQAVVVASASMKVGE